MAVKVCKFGGSSLADASQFQKVKQIVLSDPQRRYVVPSAPGKRSKDDRKITDLLYLCHAHAEQQIDFDSVFDLIRQRYLQIVQELGLDLDLADELDTVKQTIAQGASRDYAGSRGEYLNGLIMAAWLDCPFVDAAQVIHFEPNGRLNQSQTQTMLRQVLSQHERAVVPGFYGSLPDGSIKTFSRGGSDVSGSLVARGVSASVYENWTDVSGLLMTDPRIVPHARKIETVTYQELRELSYMGANVLHDEAVFPVRAAGIPVNIRNTNEPDDDGTMIVSDDHPAAVRGAITGIAGRRDFTIIQLEKGLMNAEVGFGRRVLGVLEQHGVSFEHMPSGIDTLSVIVASSELANKQDDVLDDLKRACEPDRMDVVSNVALIATVGRGMAQTPGTAARLFAALAQADVNIRMIDQGSSELNIIVGIEAGDFEKAICAIYDGLASDPLAPSTDAAK